MLKQLILTSLLCTAVAYAQEAEKAEVNTVVDNVAISEETKSADKVATSKEVISDIAQVSAPKRADIPLKYSSDLSSIAQQTATAFKTALEFTPSENKKTYYFDNSGVIVGKPTIGGFYRQILGKTAHGQIVGQDFYQDSKTPQTAPFLFIENADLENFGTDQNDGQVIWFNNDGAVTQILAFDNGNHTGESVFFRKGYITTQVAQASVAVYYENSDKLMAYIETALPNKTRQMIFFREDGSVIFQITLSDGKREMLAWDKSGKSIAPSTIASETDALLDKSEGILYRAGNGE